MYQVNGTQGSSLRCYHQSNAATCEEVEAWQIICKQRCEDLACRSLNSIPLVLEATRLPSTRYRHK